MKRRTVLACASAGLVGGLGGCLSGGESPSDDESSTETPSSEDSGTDMRLSLVSVDDGPGPLAFDVDVVDDLLTSTAVPVLEIAVENRGNEAATWLYAPTGVGSVSDIAFPCQRATPDKLTIGFESEVIRLLVDDGGCARTGTEIDRAQAPVEAELAPGEALEQRYAIAGNDRKVEDQCPPADTYRTECPYEDYGRWGFEMELGLRES